MQFSNNRLDVCEKGEVADRNKKDDSLSSPAVL